MTMHHPAGGDAAPDWAIAKHLGEFPAPAEDPIRVQGKFPRDERASESHARCHKLL